MKNVMLILALISTTQSFAGSINEDEYSKEMHAKFCALIKESNKKVDVATCTSSGEVTLGGYNSDEIVYQLHKVRLFKNSTKKYFCIISGGEGGLLFEGCQDWSKVN